MSRNLRVELKSFRNNIKEVSAMEFSLNFVVILKEIKLINS